MSNPFDVRQQKPGQVGHISTNIQTSISKLLRKTMNVRADISRGLCYDVALNYRNDMTRLAQADIKGLRPAKYVAYMAFWMRKIKPVSNAYDSNIWQHYKINEKTIPFQYEIVDINEKVSIRFAFDQLEKYNKNGHLLIHDEEKCLDVPISYNKENFRDEMKKFCHQKLGVDGKCVLETLITDMRYRTFGPHHLVHLFDQFVFRLYKRNDTTTPN